MKLRSRCKWYTRIAWLRLDLRSNRSRQRNIQTDTVYAWSDAEGNFTVTLGIPPAIDPHKAVKASRGGDEPRAMKTDKIDNAILSVVLPKWQKVAAIIAKAARTLPELPRDSGYQTIADRIGVLVKAGRLNAQGDIQQWMYGEVSLPQS